MAITKCPCCGHISHETHADVKGLAEEALNEACLVIQKKLGQHDGGLASHHFSDGRVFGLLCDYILTEIQWANEHAAEVVDAGNTAKQ